MEQNFVSVSCNTEKRNYPLEIIQDKDPLEGTCEVANEPKVHRHDRVVFAEPVFIPSTVDDDVEKIEILTPSKSAELIDAEDIMFYDSIPVQKSRSGRRKYHIHVPDKSHPKCPLESCGRSFASVTRLREHVRKVHCAERDRFECSACDATFPLHYLLERHMAVHRGTKRECPVCHRLLSARSSLVAHLRSHGGVRPFTCTVCARGFTRRSSLVVHERYVHGGALACDKCQASFTRRVDLQRHMRESHGGERSVACESCGLLFGTLAALGAHRSKKHKECNIRQQNSSQDP